ncbi:MAG: hypothetical protein U5P41_14680 [Gammaproteobacteria bacterium]|nr:hypothetical protein [Gammaproteobacteria bacterium]
MDIFEKIGYLCLGIIALLYIVALIYGLVSAGPFGIMGLIGIVGIGALLIKVLKERITNKEDSYYSRNVEK